MKLHIIRGRLSLTRDKLVPSFSAVDVTEDDLPYDTVLRWYSFEWLGWSINIDIPVHDRTKRRFIRLTLVDLVHRILGVK